MRLCDYGLRIDIEGKNGLFRQIPIKDFLYKPPSDPNDSKAQGLFGVLYHGECIGGVDTISGRYEAYNKRGKTIATSATFEEAMQIVIMNGKNEVRRL